MNTTTLVMNEEQTNIVIKALDFYSRILSGQVEEIPIVLRLANLPFFKSYYDTEGMERNIENGLTHLRLRYFPQAHSNSGVGIGNAPVEAKIAYDMQQVVRHAVAWHNEPSGGLTRDFDTPMQWAVEVPLATATVE
jgi:hypothetical protein